MIFIYLKSSIIHFCKEKLFNENCLIYMKITSKNLNGLKPE